MPDTCECERSDVVVIRHIFFGSAAETRLRRLALPRHYYYVFENLLSQFNTKTLPRMTSFVRDRLKTQRYIHLLQ